MNHVIKDNSPWDQENSLALLELVQETPDVGACDFFQAHCIAKVFANVLIHLLHACNI